MIEPSQISTTHCGNNPFVGVKKIEYVPTHWISSFPDIINNSNTLVGNIVLISGKNWLSIPSLRNTQDIQSKTSQSEKGSYINHIISLFINGVSGVLEKELMILSNVKLIVKVTLKDDTTKIYGTPYNPCLLQHSFSNKNDKQGFNVTISYNSATIPPFI